MPTYRRADRLQAVVAALLADPGTAELVVVVDGCRDGSLERLEAIAAADSRLRPLWIENRGENGAREAGIRAATRPVVLLIDDDVLAGPGLVSGHAAHHCRRDDLVVLGYMPVRAPAGAPARLYAAWYEQRCRAYEAEPQRVLENLWAGNFSLPRDAALSVGLHNPRFDALYNPDRDLGLRLAAAGLAGRFDRALTAEHLYERSLGEFLRDAAATGEGTWLVHRLHAGALGPLPHDAYVDLCSPRTRPVVRLARRPRSRPAIRAAAALARAAEATRVRRVGERATSLAFAMAQQRASLERDRREAVLPA